MVRKSSLILALISWMASTCVYALGLGDIHVHSALNQNLDASIDLMSVEKGGLDDLRVSLASPEAFERAGVDRPFLLTNLRFKPERLPDGSAVIRVTTRDAVREPFLNFLVEVNWPKGRVVREYTLLLDPPVTLSRAPAPVAAPTTAPAPAPVPKVTSGPPVTVSPQATGKAAPPAGGMAMAGEGPGEYGPVKKGDSLWQIASRSAQPGVDINQMMVAIYRANPNAFFGDNLNNLKRGEILRIPSREEVAEIDRTEARDQYRHDLNVWMAERAAPAPAPVPAKTAAEETTTAPPAKPAVKETTAAKPAAPKEATPEAELKIATARPEGEGEAGASDEGKTNETSARLNQELLLAREETEGARQQGEELQARVADLEGQLKDMERLLALKSDQLAQLQTAATQGTAGPEGATAAMGEQPAAAESAMAEQPAAEQPTTEQPAAESPAAEPSAMAETAPPAVTPEPKPAPKPAPKPVAKKPQPKPEPGLLGGLLDNPMLLVAAAGILLILLILLGMTISRRKARTNDFEESILLGGRGDSTVTEATTHSGGAGSAHVDETSFLSDFSPSDIDALQDETGEVDPLSEADVYIAYGRYQQAEELIRQAIERDPERFQLHFKLFEILHAVKDANGFSAFAEEISGTAVADSDPAAWQKVLAMGAELAPDNPLFAGTQEMGETPAEEVADVELDSEMLDLDAITAELDAEEQGAAEKEDDFDLSAFTADLGDEMKSELEDTGASDLGLDLDLDSSLADLDVDVSTDMGLDIEEPTPAAETQSAEPGVGERTIPSIDILNLAGEAEAIPETELEAHALEEDKVVSLTGEEPDTEGFSLGDLEGGLETDSMFIEAADADEVNTKLDLARAYIDMGDPEGAQDILAEVLTEGNDAQRQEAQRLREQLS